MTKRRLATEPRRFWTPAEDEIRRLFGAGEPLPAKDIDRLVDFYARSLAGYSEQLETDLYRRQMSQQRVLRQWEEKLWASPESARRAVKIWQTRDDDRVREAHRVMDGVAVPFESQFVTPDAGLIVAPPVVYGCLLPETPVAARGLVSAYRRVFNGEVVTIKTAVGHVLTCTPNHPILTPAGFVPAGALLEGQQVVSRRTSERSPCALPHVDSEHVPTTAQQVFETLSLAAHYADVAQVPITPHDFHGDGAHGQVHIVRADRQLRDRFSAGIPQPLRELRFATTLADAEPHRGERHATPRFAADASPPRGFVGLAHLEGSLLARHARPFHQLSFAAPTDGDTALLEARPDSETRDAEGARDRILRLPADVTTDHIVHVNRFAYMGHVYNLETEDGWYLADGVVVHNCRCFVKVVVLDGELERGPGGSVVLPEGVV